MDSLKALHIPYGSPMIELCKALQKKGIDATSCHFYDNKFKFKPDVSLHLNRKNNKEREIVLERFFQEAMKNYDIFHFHFGETFFSDKRDLPILKQAGKKLVVHHHGSDIRMYSLAKKNNPYVRVKPEWTEEKITENVRTLSHYIDHAIVQDPELEEYIKHTYKHTHIIPHTVDTSKFIPEYPEGKKVPLIVHAPTMRDLKGTEFILHAVRELKRMGLIFQFQLIENKTYDQTKRLLSQADIVIDQLRIGASGFISSEAMAHGKPVICFIRDDLVSKYPSDLPIVNANPSNLIYELKRLLDNPQIWSELGKQGRSYIEKHHSASVVADRYINIYKQL
ncbi:glycosyltransferase family 4 protein [Salinibacillus aidingensis]|uniref:Glycosyltransferase family 4 protein n=1 Tax=Salinibacillus aidingensis TaxID=237684 RepID=A0ABP3KZ83_9BACI